MASINTVDSFETENMDSMKCSEPGEDCESLKVEDICVFINSDIQTASDLDKDAVEENKINEENDIDQRSNNATSVDSGISDKIDVVQVTKTDDSQLQKIPEIVVDEPADIFDDKAEASTPATLHGKEPVTVKKSPVPTVGAPKQEFLEVNEHFREYKDEAEARLAYATSSCTDSPAISSQDGGPYDDDDSEYTAGDERIASIEEEYIQRISVLEQRHFELEDVLGRLTTSLEASLSIPVSNELVITNEIEEDESPDMGTITEASDVVAPSAAGGNVEGQQTEKEKTTQTTDWRKLSIDLFVEFQQKIRNFAADLNGVLNCSEAAIRHARVVQEWATSVQMMFEQIKDERQKILNYIDERERNMLIAKEQFVTELHEQGKQLEHLVSEMKSYEDLRERGEQYCRSIAGDIVNRHSVAESIVDVVLKNRMGEEKSIILSLSKQSKISEMKLFIIHQQSCIQQLQEQNRELKAIIEGLMGPDDIEDEELCDTDQTGTPASVGTPDRCPVRDTLERHEEPAFSLVSDVLYCDRAEYLPGTSTDGDVATVQAYDIGGNSARIESGKPVVFDPLTVSYVREQCQLAEETERRAHAADNIEVEDVTKVQLSPECDVTNECMTSDCEVQVLQNGVEAVNIEPYLRRCAEEEELYDIITNDHEAAGDGVDVSTQKPTDGSPEKNEGTSSKTVNTTIASEPLPDGVISDLPRPISPI